MFLLMSVGISGKWKDQGWGNRKGKIRLVLKNTSGDIVGSRTSALAPHTEANFSWSSEDFSGASTGEKIEIQAMAGAGGGHELYLKDTSFVVKYVDISD